jgi:hypothetical protein
MGKSEEILDKHLELRCWTKTVPKHGNLYNTILDAINEALRIHDVVGRSEQLKGFMHFAEFAKQEYGLHIPLNLMKEYVKSL